MPLYSPPKSFMTRLQCYDPLLRVRWSDFEERWRIERKIVHARSIDPALFKEQHYEEFCARREGYVPVLYCHKEQLDNGVLLTLYAADIQRQGGAAAVAKRLDEEESAYRRKSRARWLDDVYLQARDYYNIANSLTSTRRSLGYGPPGS